MGMFIHAEPDPEFFVGRQVVVIPKGGDAFSHEFSGQAIGVRNGNVEVRDQDDNVWEVDVDQLSLNLP